MANVNTTTFKKLKTNYQKAAEWVDEYFSDLPQETKNKFYRSFHIRPTSNSLRIVCIEGNSRFAMRTHNVKANDKTAFQQALTDSLRLLSDMSILETRSAKEIEIAYGFKPYELGKRQKQTEFVIQAKFAQYLQEQDYKVITTEFNIKKGNRQRVDIIATCGKDLWLIEIKDGDVKTDATQQVNAYKALVEENRQICYELLHFFDKALQNDYTVKTAVVYTRGKKSNEQIDRLWKYNNGIFEQE